VLVARGWRVSCDSSGFLGVMDREGVRYWSVEAKVFEVQIKGGNTGVRIYECSKKKKSSIFVRREELAWLVGALEEVAESDKAEIFWDLSRAGFPRILTQKRSNRHGRFLSIEEFDGRRRAGILLIPEGRCGLGWARLMVELEGARSILWEGRELKDRKKEKETPGSRRHLGSSKSSNNLEQVRLLGKGEMQKAISVNMLSKAATSENGLGEMAPTKTQGQAGRVLASEQTGDEVCGGAGPERTLGGAKTEDRWMKALLSPAPKLQGEPGLAFQGQVGARATVVSEKVSGFNATEELLSCREWMRGIRGMVEAGLQRLGRSSD
jgi:hypothetical protein